MLDTGYWIKTFIIELIKRIIDYPASRIQYQVSCIRHPVLFI